MVCCQAVALVRPGIIENHEELRARLQARGYVFESQTDTEVIAHLVDSSTRAICLKPAGRCGRTAWRLRHRSHPSGRTHRVVGATRLAAHPGRGQSSRGTFGQRRHGPGE